jgi:hypothetical protein
MIAMKRWSIPTSAVVHLMRSSDEANSVIYGRRNLYPIKWRAVRLPFCFLPFSRVRSSPVLGNLTSQKVTRVASLGKTRVAKGRWRRVPIMADLADINDVDPCPSDCSDASSHLLDTIADR